MPTNATLTVDLDAVAGNTRLLTSRTSARLMAVVKADAFGHGDVAGTVLRAGAAALGVTSIEEAVRLRQEGAAAPVLSWLNAVDADFCAAVSADVELAVPSLHHLRAVTVAAARVGRRARIHLHADVGMARDGASQEEWSLLARLARQWERRGEVTVVGVMGHLSSGGGEQDEVMQLQVQRFRAALEAARRRGLRPQVAHLAATAATLSDRRSHFGMVRVGAGLFGLGPSRSAGCRGAMTLTAPVVGVRDVPAGTGVGYGHTWSSSRRTRLALVPVGYADGLPGAASGSAQVQLRGQRLPVVGAISMDQVVVDVGDLPVGTGERVTVFGPGDRGEPTVAEWAGWGRTVEQEIVARIGPRVARVHVPQRDLRDCREFAS